MRRILTLAFFLLTVADLLAAQTSPPDSAARKPKAGAQFLIPLASIALPGLGQYLHGDALAGLGYTATAFASIGLGANAAYQDLNDFPRGGREQFETVALQTFSVAAGLSAYDAFRRSVPALQRGGKYRFITEHESTGRLLTAPFDPAFLKRWTTWVDLAHTALVAAIFVADRREPGARYREFRGHDAAFAMGISAAAALSEEAIFRGWLYPFFQQQMGPGTFLPNAAQSALFAAAHIPNRPGLFILDIGAWAFFEGWLTRRNGWSVRESIFHHFWYDVVIIGAALATERDGTIGFSIPLRF